ncbi:MULTISPECIES: hypothetical protein [unclassified Pseudovibrio]|uniref:hypothetical protein n=1 Tax=unclassified Pseudovibrio TaxID=2627060 RepID=UPI0007AE9B03|nr:MULTISPECIES: hypothetical protein [unclassified Pseudovibrio]KZL18649.1 hypothetical protein PsAD37_03826 [Pseudovibrio sp. Ad37]KZL23675.1 hypothetical protein PsWM33_02963 [Pseudovibrio sp. WM33]
MGDYKTRKRNLISRDTPQVETTSEIVTEPAESRSVEEIISQLVQDRPSEHEAFVNALRKSKRENVAYSQVPVPIIEMMEARQKELGLKKKEYFYHLLRNDGLKIPTAKELDARNRG